MISTWSVMNFEFLVKGFMLVQSEAVLIGTSCGTRFSVMIFMMSVPVFSK